MSYTNELTSRQTEANEYTSDAVEMPDLTSGNRPESNSSGDCHLIEPLARNDVDSTLLSLESKIRDNPKSAILGSPISSTRILD